MGCPDHDCCPTAPSDQEITFPGTYDHDTPWKFYNHLIGGIDEGPIVTDYCLGTHWTYLEADCGVGISFTTKGGGKRTVSKDLRGLPLRTVAELSKSWCFEEASIGVAALNAWYARRELLDPLGAVYDEPTDAPEGTIRKMDAFELYRPKMQGANVTVIGHFPHVDRIAEYANVTVLERNCTDAMDTPDPGCEYIIPKTDFLFMTGVTIINKTAPRLLDLSKNATTIMVGPSVIPSPFVFEWGVETLAGSIVADPEKAKFAVKTGVGQFFGEALQMMSMQAGDAK